MDFIKITPDHLLFSFSGMGCNECTHPSCQHSLNSLGIGQCVECDSGVLVLDPTSGPKWRMACNKCNVLVHFFEHAHRVQVSQIYDHYKKPIKRSGCRLVKCWNWRKSKDVAIGFVIYRECKSVRIFSTLFRSLNCLLTFLFSLIHTVKKSVFF